MIYAHLGEFGIWLNQDPCLGNVIHRRTVPSLLVIGQWQIVLLTFCGRVFRTFDATSDPDIIKAIRIRVADDNEKIIQSGGVSDLEFNLWFDAT